MYPTGAESPKFYGLPKIHKEGVPLRPTVSSRGVSKERARILKPLVENHNTMSTNTMDFVQYIRCIHLQQDEYIISYDVKALFTSVPIRPSINIIKKHLEQDKELQQRTMLTVNDIMCLLEFCLKNTNFLFQGRYYEHLEGVVMGSPISPTVANLCMEDFEAKALSTSPDP